MSGNKRFSEKEARFFLSYAMAAKLHEGWRETRQMRNSKGELFFEPYWKVTKDKVFIFNYLKHLKDGETNTKGNIRNSKGKLEIDIANLTFNELPRDLQAKNLASAEMAIDLVYAPVIRGEEITLPGGQRITPEDIKVLVAKTRDVWSERYSSLKDQKQKESRHQYEIIK